MAFLYIIDLFVVADARRPIVIGGYLFGADPEELEKRGDLWAELQKKQIDLGPVTILSFSAAQRIIDMSQGPI